MALRQIYGHQAVRDRLAGTLASSRFPQAALLIGPQGVGKQRLALWVAQGLLCEHGPGGPCSACAACQQVQNLAHPDLHWFVPIARPRGTSDPDRAVEEAKELLGDVMAERRQTGLWQRPDGMAGHALASVRLLVRGVWLTPFSASRKVFIVGDAERLVVQEASTEAANALLKVLEEPPADTTLILTAADPHALLPTIRSRLVPIRIPRVADADVREFLRHEVRPALSARALERRTLLADGCIGQALAADEEGQGADQAAARLLEAIREGPAAWLPLAAGQRWYAARGDFTAMLDALAVRLRAEMGEAAGAGNGHAAARLEALRRVEETRSAARGNVNPQLALAVLARELESLV